MQILKFNKKTEVLKSAAEAIKKGKLVVYPTDTLYALGCNALDENAVARVFKVKRRATNKPLPIAVASLAMMKKYALVDKRALRIAKEFLPGALTLVLKKKRLPGVLTAGRDDVAIRIPDSEIALKLIKLAGVPVVATSANISEQAPPISPKEVLEQIKDADIILDAGNLKARVPSTILDLTGEPKVLREGKVDKSALKKILKTKI